MGTLSKNKIKYIRSLEVKKVRKEERVFLAEGPKLVGDLLGHFHCRFLAATSSWFRKHTDVSADELIEISSEELSRASLLKTPQEVLAVFEQPVYELSDRFVRRSLCLALDDIQDPGNLGTIIRLPIGSVSSTSFARQTRWMYTIPRRFRQPWAIARVKVHYISLPEFIRSLEDVPVFGTFLDGKNIYQQPLSAHGLIVMGNEGNGIGKETGELINRRLYIPNYPEGQETSESLNVAIATAVICAEFRRQAAWK